MNAAEHKQQQADHALQESKRYAALARFMLQRAKQEAVKAHDLIAEAKEILGREADRG